MFSKIFRKKYLLILLIFAIFLNSSFRVFAFEDAFSNKEYAEPFFDEDEHFSQATIIDQNKIVAKSPINPTPSDISKDDNYLLVDNYNIDITTIPYRIEYFSPTYLYAKSVATNKIVSSIYSVGGSEDNIDTIRNIIKSLPSQTEIVKNLQSVIFGYSKALIYLRNVNKNFSLENAKNQLSKAMISAVISYNQLNCVIDIYDKQVELYDKVYKLYQKNAVLGISTSIDVRKHQLDYENSKKTLSLYKNTQKNLKKIICINLGYNIGDIDKLNFIDLQVDETYVNNIDINKDYELAYRSNATYNSLVMSGKSNKKLPESTSRASYENILNNTEQKIITKMMDMYAELLSCKSKYELSRYNNEILILNTDSATNKYLNNLVSATEYLGLKISNLAIKMEVENAKFNYINAINNYYYGTFGIVDIN